MDDGIALSSTIDSSAGFDSGDAGGDSGTAEGDSFEFADQVSSTETGSTETPPEQTKELPGVQEPPEKPATPDRYKVKAGGKEHEFTLDELIKHAQMGFGAQQRFEEAAQRRKDLETVVSALKDPRTAPQMLQRLGIDVNAYVQEQIQRMQYESQMTPEQYERYQLEMQLQEAQQARQQYEAQMREEQVARQAALVQEQYTKLFTQALSDQKIPVGQHQIARMAGIVQALVQQGYAVSPETVAYAAEHVKQEYEAEILPVVKGLSPKDLLSRLGDEYAETLRKHFASQVTTAIQPSTGEAPPPVQRGKSKEPMTTDELWQELQGTRTPF